MNRRRPKLYLVGQNPTDIFSDMDRLRTDLKERPAKRSRATETFARIPHDKALALYRHRLGPAAWAVLVELDRIVLKRRGQNPVRLVSSRLRAVGISAQIRA